MTIMPPLGRLRLPRSGKGGSDRLEENGLWLSKGLGNHMTWHCFGLGDITSGMEQDRGYCAGTDPNGDQLVADVASDEKYPADAKSFGGKLKFTTGTGKYAGSAALIEIPEQPDRTRPPRRQVKLRIGPMLGFKQFRTAVVTVAGIKLLRRIQKGQFNLGRLRLKDRRTPAVWKRCWRRRKMSPVEDLR